MQAPVKIKLGGQNYLFRKARGSDSPKIVSLLKQMFTLPPHGFSEKNALRILRSIEKTNEVFNLVVESNDAIVASVLAYFVEYPRFGKRMFVEDFVVDQRLRGNGLGSSMLKHLKRVAKDEKCTGIVLHTGKNNKLAQEFYRKNGMDENVMYKLDLS